MGTTDAAAEQMLRRAQAARAAGRFAEAQQLLDAAASAAPQNPRILNACGLRALADQNHDRAVKYFVEAIQIDVAEPALWLNLATAHRAKRDDVSERLALQAALDIDRCQLTAQLRMAELEERGGRLSDAALHWNAVVQLGQQIEDAAPSLQDAVNRGRLFLNRHNLEYAKALELELGDLVTDDQRGNRFRACVDHMLGRRKLYRNECSGLHYPFLPADEFFDRSLFPWFAELEAKTPVIREEARALMESGCSDLRPYVRLEPGTPDNKWSSLNGSLEWGACFLWEYGVRNDAVCALCPATAAAIEAVPQNRIPGKAPTAFFFDPQTGRAYSATYRRYQYPCDCSSTTRRPSQVQLPGRRGDPQMDRRQRLCL
jgi:aspartate beta-hydroxylase